MEFDATFLISAISFVVFVIIMNTIFYAPIMRIMSERERLVEENYNSAKKLNDETLKQEEYHKNELEITRNEARITLDSKMQKMKSEKSIAINEYKNELFDNISKEKENLMNSALETKETLKDNVVDIAKNISNILLGDNINISSIDKSQIKEE